MAIRNSIINRYYDAGSALHDATKILRTNIQFSCVDKEIKTIVLTSVIPGEGKSTVTSFLGIAMAENKQKVLLVECDCRRPMLQNNFLARPAFHIMDVLSKAAPIESAIVHTEVPGLDLLSSIVLANPVEMLGSNRFWGIIEKLQEQYDVILIDTPPLGSFIEAAILASKADGTILVLQPGTTEIRAAQDVVSQLEKAKAHVLGVVLNNVEMPSGNYYYADYYARRGKLEHRKRNKNRKVSIFTRKSTSTASNVPTGRGHVIT